MTERSTVAVRRTYRPFGARFIVEAAATAATEVFQAAQFIARYPANAGLDLTFRLVVTSAPACRDGASGPATAEPWPRVIAQQRPDGIDVAVGASWLATWPNAGRAELSLDPSTRETPDAVRLLVEAAFWSLAISGAHVHGVHSALVGSGHAGLLLRGESGAGKSTLSYACLRRGMWLSSDDWVYALVGRRPDRLWGYPWRAWMTTDAAARFAELAEIAPLPHPSAEGVKVPIVPPAGRRRIGSPVSAVVFIDRHSDLELRSIDAAEARQRFIESALDSERQSLPSGWLAELFDRPCFVLQRGTSPEAAAAELHGLARRLAVSRRA